MGHKRTAGTAGDPDHKEKLGIRVGVAVTVSMEGSDKRVKTARSKNLEEMFATMPPVCIYEPCPAPRRLTEPRIPDRPHVG